MITRELKHEPERQKASRRLLPISAVQEALGGVHKTTIYGFIRESGFPLPVKLGGASRWIADEVDAWVAGCPKKIVVRNKPPGR